MNSPIRLEILSKHSNLTDAVLASGIDLSYNKPLALQDLRRMDAGYCNGITGALKPVTEAFVVAVDRAAQSYDTVRDGKVVEVYYLLDCDLKLLNKYSAFSACLHNGPFYPVELQDTAIIINTNLPLSSSIKRNVLAMLDFTLCKL